MPSFYFEQVLQTALNGIDQNVTGPVLRLAGVILILSLLYAVYEAYSNGGDVRALGVRSSIRSKSCAPRSSSWPRATMKPGSSRGMDTRRQHKSEQSKRRRNLRLTNRSTKPYPWRPKQAQPDVSKPGRST